MKIVLSAIFYLLLSTALFGSGDEGSKKINFAFEESKTEKVVVIWREMSDLGQSVGSGIIVFEQDSDGVGLRVGIDSDVSISPFWNMSGNFAGLNVELKFYSANSVDVLMWEGALDSLRSKNYQYINSTVFGRHFKIDLYRLDGTEEFLSESFTVPGYPLFVHEYLKAKIVK